MDVLIKRDWTEKTKDRYDRRITILRLTNKGQVIQEQIEERIDFFGDTVYASIAIEDRDEVKEILSSFHWTLSKMLLRQV